MKYYVCELIFPSELEFNHPHIVGCCKGRRNSAYGFKWPYANEDLLL